MLNEFFILKSQFKLNVLKFLFNIKTCSNSALSLYKFISNLYVKDHFTDILINSPADKSENKTSLNPYKVLKSNLIYNERSGMYHSRSK